ncbi:MAG: hypothetical protein E3J72_18620 [Planctomycetota bacterium]|nr:MAG: hypothetical protein E3J72_18620 [Planctomycetota bacterium]
MNLVRQKVNSVLEMYENPKSNMKAVLEDIQMTFGCLPKAALHELANQTNIALVRIHSFIDSSNGFVLEEDIKQAVEICNCPSCRMSGGREIREGLDYILLVDALKNGGNGKAFYTKVHNNPEAPCAKPPTALVNGHRYCDLTLSGLLEIIGMGNSTADEN